MPLTHMFINNFGQISGGIGEAFFSKLSLVDCKTGREIEGEQLENGIKFPREMAANSLRETGNCWKKVLALQN